MAPFVVTQLAQMTCRVLLGRLLDPLPHNRPVVRVETGPAVTPGRFLEAFREIVTRPGPPVRSRDCVRCRKATATRAMAPRRKRWPPRALARPIHGGRSLSVDFMRAWVGVRRLAAPGFEVGSVGVWG